MVGGRARNALLKNPETQVHSYALNCLKIVNYFHW